jgi:predicted metal-dependent HD superfamily phosphohydrolase
VATVSDDAELRAAWSDAVGNSPEAWEVFDGVVGRHRAQERRYHGLRHVTWTVRHVRELSAIVPVTDEAAVIVAAFFHDAVYDVTADDNEARSAALAERVLGDLGWSDDRCSRVARLIMATAGHEPTDEAGQADEAVIVDADLAVLGSEPAAYQAYVTGVRAEYGQLDDEQWRTGRRAVLGRFLGRERLYSTEPGRSRWERRARANMAAELASLDARGELRSGG